VKLLLEGNVNISHSGCYVEAARRLPGVIVRIGSKTGAIDLAGAEPHTPWGERSVFTAPSGELVVVDAQDASSIERGWDFTLLEACSTYFKTSISPESVAHPKLAPYRHKIRPIAPVYPIRPTKPYLSYPLLPRHPQSAFRKRRLTDLLRLPTLKWMEETAKTPRTRDYYFVTAYYRGAEYDEMNAQRALLIAELRSSRALTGVAGFASRDPLPPEYEGFRLPWVAMTSYLRDLATARVGVYVRGIDENPSFKLAQYMQLGLPVVGERIVHQTDQQWFFDIQHDALGIDDPKEIVRAVERVAADPKARQRLSEQSSRVFREHLSPDALAGQLAPAFAGARTSLQ
jgi:hypothetical protein